MSTKSVAWEVEASEFCRGDRGELCALAPGHRPPISGCASWEHAGTPPGHLSPGSPVAGKVALFPPSLQETAAVFIFSV